MLARYISWSELWKALKVQALDLEQELIELKDVITSVRVFASQTSEWKYTH